ncbi:MAG TPA: GAF domain-containing protein [Pyrinomonadaceae bacterium]|jgi:GAF domain-containing protein
MSEYDTKFSVEPEPDTVTSAETSALFDYLREATEQLEVVNRVVAAVNSSRTIEEVFGLATEQMRSLIPFDRASIALCEEDSEHLRVFALSGEHAGSLALGAVAVLRGSVTELALKAQEMIVIPELSTETRFNTYDDLQRESFRSAVCCPLFSTHGPIGSLNLTSRTPDAYERKHLLALERLAPPLAIAIEKILLLEQTELRSRQMEAVARREELAGRIGRKLSGSLDPTSALQETVDMLGAALNAARCHITLFEPQSGYALVSYEYRARPEVASLRGHRIPFRASEYAQRVLESDQPVMVADLHELDQDELVQLYKRLAARAALSAPVSIGGQHRGWLEVQDCAGPRRWTEDDGRLMAAVAAHVSAALTNARLYEASRRRGEELEGLYKISRAFSTLKDTSDIYGNLTRAIAELIGAERCLLATYDRRLNQVRAEAPSYNILPELIQEFRFTLDKDGSSAYIFRTDEPFFSNDPAHDTRFNQNFIERYGIRSVIGVPLRIKRELIGFIYVANRPGGFRERDVRLLEIFAAQAAETIANARLFTTIQAQAEREAIVNRLLLALQHADDATRGIEIVIERVGEVMGLDRCIATLFPDQERTEFLGEWCAAGVAPITHETEIKERSPVAYWIKINRRPFVVPDVFAHELAGEYMDLIERMELKSLAVVPIMHRGRVIGSLSAHQTREYRRWLADDIDLLTAVATQIGSTLENARLISELREANRLKDEFLATLSHELRTPLTAIQGWVELLGENEAVAFDEELADGIGVIKNSTDSLTQLISDLLDLSRIQRRGLQLERKRANINTIILEALQAVRQSVAEHQLDLLTELEDSLPLISVDPHRIQQVLWNLLNNAIKFTPAGGRITVRSRLVDERGVLIPEGSRAARWIVLEVDDTGEGIPQDFLPYIWDRFRQADASSTRRHGGLGIGLALVKELVEAHGGHAEARSDEGGGASFRVRLPVLEPEPKVDQQRASQNEFSI